MSIEELIAERAIYRQLIRFARAMDSRDWDTLKSITASDIKADFGMGEIEGSNAVVEFIRSFLDNCGTTQHILGNIIIDVTGTEATSQTYVSDIHLGKGSASDIHFRTLGNYADKWVEREGSWLMTHRIKDNRATIGSMDVFKP